MALRASVKSCDGCPAATNPEVQGRCGSVSEVQAAQMRVSGLDKSTCIARIQAAVAGFSGKIKTTAKI